MGPDFLHRYGAALTDYLRSGSEASLHGAYELGRQALGVNMSLLDLAGIYHEALATALQATPAGDEAVRRVEAAGRFLLESLSPFDLIRLGNQEANASLRRLNTILEEEARRIAHALHDEAGQLLASVYLELSELAREASEPAQLRVGRIKANLDQVREQLRRLSHEFRPPVLDQLGLVPALRFLGDGIGGRAALAVSVEGSTGGRLSGPLETAIYRVVQEALTNVTRHARARHVRIFLRRRGGELHCAVQDDGVGFDVSRVRAPGGRKGLGLIGIEERVAAFRGRVELHSMPGRGTVVQISLPAERANDLENPPG